MIASVSKCVTFLKQTGEIVLSVHTKGYLHSDLKGNNVLLDGANHNPILTDFGKSRKISNARLLKPKFDIRAASKRLHGGDRQSIASDAYSAVGTLIHRVLKDGKFNVPALKSTAKKCLTTSPGKRLEITDVLKEMGLLSYHCRTDRSLICENTENSAFCS